MCVVRVSENLYIFTVANVMCLLNHKLKWFLSCNTRRATRSSVISAICAVHVYIHVNAGIISSRICFSTFAFRTPDNYGGYNPNCWR